MDFQVVHPVVYRKLIDKIK